ncbi:hypothetical protein QR680_015098 [Steinernema hermaphroditum]|uniref:G-protein coupled receptors family 1 profile domain-containing protein n=1 Tax=Steinernema hermaphroditum TaxID=289476 RepID=A0AA39M504_9BILA|nr:hypothetical protein QR680_015098 [Steinernema hermaphroditum]
MTQEMFSNATEEFHYGSELQGRGHMTRLDTFVGLSILLLASGAVMVGFLNFQPKDIDPTVGIVAWTVAFFFGFESCIMVQSVSVNRMIAVCSPLNYDYIFSRRVTGILITITWCAAALVIVLYYVFQVLANNSKESGREEYFILAYDTLILTQLNNGLALVLFNPEVHELLGLNFWRLRKKTPTVIPHSTTVAVGSFANVIKLDN